MKKEKIFIGSDHGGFKLKEYIEKKLEKKGYEVADVGTHNEDSVDYPDFAKKVALKVKKEKAKGILLCGTGIGVSITANKVKGIRAALVHNLKTARLAKEHNDANIICFGGRTTAKKKAAEMINEWLSGKFEKGRHLRRIKKIE